MCDMLYRVKQDMYNKSNISIHIYKIKKETPTGMWIYDHYRNGFFQGLPKWIKKNAKRPYAHKTKEEAIKSFIARKDAHLSFLNRDIRAATSAREKALTLLKKEECVRN